MTKEYKEITPNQLRALQAYNQTFYNNASVKSLEKIISDYQNKEIRILKGNLFSYVVRKLKKNVFMAEDEEELYMYADEYTEELRYNDNDITEVHFLNDKEEETTAVVVKSDYEFIY